MMRGFVVLCSLIFITSLILNGCDGKDSVNSSTKGSVVIKDGDISNSNNTDSKSDNGNKAPTNKDNNNSDKNSSNDDNGSKDNGDNNNSKNNSDDNKKSDDGKKDNNSSKKDSDSKDKGDDNKKDSNNSIKTLTLSIEKTTLNKDHNTTITLNATYDDNSTNTPTSVEWLITPKDAVAIKGTTLTALKDINVTIQAKVGNTLSNKVKLNIYWEVNGYRLPPEPDPKINNATLLGVDVNHNGVRDDVERWIYKTYHHPIERGIMLQNAYRLQMQISDINKAHEYARLSNKSLSCEYYLEDTYKWFKEKYEYSTTSKVIKKIQFNTLKRYMAYQRYNAQFNGEIFDEKITSNKENCYFDKRGNLRINP